MKNFIRSPVQFVNESEVMYSAELEQYMAKKQIDAIYAANIARINYEKEISVAQKKADISLKIHESKRRHAEERETETLTIVTDSRGELRYLISRESKDLVSQPFLSVSNIRLTKILIESCESPVFSLQWDGNDGFIILSKVTVKILEKALTENGVDIYLTRKHKKEVMELLLSRLFDLADELVIPKTPGWFFNDKKKKWRFYDQTELTGESIKEMRKW